MPAGKSPADELAQLKLKLDQKQKDNSEIAKDMDRLKGQIASLSKTVGDIDLKTKAFEKAATGAAGQAKDLAAYVHTEKTMLEAALTGQASQDVRDAKSAALQKLKDLADALESASAAAATASREYTQAQTDTAAAQAAYIAVAALPAANADILKDLTTLRAAADKQGAANSLGRMYFLILLMVDRLAALTPLTPEDYATKLNGVGTALAAAADDETAAKEALNSALADQKDAQKDLDDGRAKWRQDMLDAIPAIAPAAPGTLVSPSSAG